MAPPARRPRGPASTRSRPTSAATGRPTAGDVGDTPSSTWSATSSGCSTRSGEGGAVVGHDWGGPWRGTRRCSGPTASGRRRAQRAVPAARGRVDILTALDLTRRAPTTTSAGSRATPPPGARRRPGTGSPSTSAPSAATTATRTTSCSAEGRSTASNTLPAVDEPPPWMTVRARRPPRRSFTARRLPRRPQLVPHHGDQPAVAAPVDREAARFAGGVHHRRPRRGAPMARG